MINDLVFEYKKARKSHALLLFISVCILLTFLFFGVQMIQQRTLYEEELILLENEVTNLEDQNQLTREFIEQLEQDGDDFEDRDETIRFNEEYILFNEHLIPYAQDVFDSFEAGDYRAFYEARMNYLEEESRVYEFVDYSHIDIVGEFEEGLSPIAQQEFDRITAFLAADEPMEDEEVSLASPNHIVLLAQFFLNPFILLVLVLLISLVFIEETSEGSLALQLTEVKSRGGWFLSNRLFSTGLFCFGLASSFLASRVLLFVFGRSFFETSPSWSAPVLLNSQVQEGFTLLSYFLLILLILVVLFLFFHQLFSFILIHIKHTVMGTVVFLSIGVLSFYITQVYQVFQHWLNPFQFFFVDEWIVANRTTEMILSIVVGFMASLFFFGLTQLKLNRSPLS